jgi:hypothetical protein
MAWPGRSSRGTTTKRYPCSEGQQHHREPERDVLDRRVCDAESGDRGGVVADDGQTRKNAVDDQLKEQHDAVCGPECLSAHETCPQHRQVDDDGDRDSHYR